MASVISSRKRGRAFSGNDTVSENKKTVKFATCIPKESMQEELIASLKETRKLLSTQTTTEIDIKLNKCKEKLIACANKRWLKRDAWDLAKEIESLETKRKYLLDGKHVTEFDMKMIPVMRRLKNASSRDRSVQGNLIREDAEREVRKLITPANAPIYLQRAAIGDMCEDCGISMKVIANDSLLGCPQCAKTRVIPIMSAPLVDSEFLSTPYQQKPRVVEWTEFCQAKEYAEPSPEVLELVMKHMVDHKLTGLEEYTKIISEEWSKNGPYITSENAETRLKAKIPFINDKLKGIKALLVRKSMQEVSSKNQDERLRKFYERSPKYAAYISGYWPLRFTNAQEERIRALYSTAVPAYDKYRKPSQPNWPGGYAYFLRCLCVLLGWDEFVQHFNVTTGQKNVLEREEIRKRIWEKELDWEFIPCSAALH